MVLISGFCYMKWPGVFLLPTEWEAGPLQGYLPSIYRNPVIHLDLGGDMYSESKLSKTTTQCPWSILRRASTFQSYTVKEQQKQVHVYVVTIIFLFKS